MRSLFMLTVGAVFLTSAYAVADSRESLPQAAAGYRLAFADDFGSLDLSPNRKGNHTWYQGMWWDKPPAPISNIAVANSQLTLTWTRGQHPSDTSIQTFSPFSTANKAWRYGYFEARMKWNPVPGAWPSFWMMPTLPQGVYSLPESGEFDIFEGNGGNPQTFYGTLHDWQGRVNLANTGKTNSFPLPAGTDFSQYHTYGMLWVPGRVTWFFDNAPLHSENTYPVMDQQDYYLVLDMNEGAKWRDGDMTGVTAERMDLSVDWVRVWQRQ